MRLVVTGGNGLLGSRLIICATSAGHETIATYHQINPGLGDECVQLDITNPERVDEIIRSYKPDVVVNCAAMTDVDGCEEQPERATAVNAEAPGTLATAATETDSEFVQVSTDYIFDGTDEGRYSESAEPSPIQTYGQTKLEGERNARNNAPDALIPRLSFIYGRHGATNDLTGFPAWVLDKFENDEAVPLFVDQRVTPSRAGAAAESIVALLERDASGVVNVAARSCVTPYEFGCRIAEREGIPSERCTKSRSSTLDRPARRPSNTCLNTSRIESILGCQQPTLEEDLDAVL